MSIAINLRDAQKMLIKKSLYEFIKHMWDTYETAEYDDSWLMEYKAECFQYSVKHFLPNYIWKDWITDEEYAYIKKHSLGRCPVRDTMVENRHTKRHNWNEPPRHSKSTVFNVCGPVWLSIVTPIKVASVCHTLKLSTEMNVKRQTLVESDKYKYYFKDEPKISLLTSTASSLRLLNGSELYAVAQTNFTGFGADVIIADDLISADNARKDKQVLRNALDFFQKTLPTRLNSTETGVIWHVQQRVGNGDIGGHIAEDKNLNKTYSQTQIKAIATNEDILIFPCSGKVKIIKKEEKLWPSRFGDYSLVKMEVGEDEFDTQFQQDPSNSKLNIWKDEYNHYITEEEAKEEMLTAEVEYASHDCPVKDGEQNDLHGFVSGFGKGTSLIITDSWEEHLGYVKEKNLLISLQTINPGLLQVIEDKSNGAPLIQDLQAAVPGLAPFNPGTNSKTQRLGLAAVYAQAGSVRFIGDPVTRTPSPKLANLINKLRRFPLVEHDDDIDALSQLILYHFTARQLGVYTKAFTYENIVTPEELDNLYFYDYAATLSNTVIKLLATRRDMQKDTYIVVKEWSFTSILDFENFCQNSLVNAAYVLDASTNNNLYSLVDSSKVIMTKFKDDDSDKSRQVLKTGLYNKKVLINRNCSQTIADISRLRITATSAEGGTDKLMSLNEGMGKCLRAIITYAKGTSGVWY